MSSNMTMTENVPEVVPDALVGIDQAGVIRFVNYQTESLFGYDPTTWSASPFRRWCLSTSGRSIPNTGRTTLPIR
jgi:hypothetical protein